MRSWMRVRERWEIFDPLFAAHDIGGYNYQLHRAPSDHARVPSRVIVQTESYPIDAFVFADEQVDKAEKICRRNPVRTAAPKGVNERSAAYRRVLALRNAIIA